jgi:hypothetical protein
VATLIRTLLILGCRSVSDGWLPEVTVFFIFIKRIKKTKIQTMIVFIGEVEQRRMRLIFGWVAAGDIAFSCQFILIASLFDFCIYLLSGMS